MIWCGVCVVVVLAYLLWRDMRRAPVKKPTDQQCRDARLRRYGFAIASRPSEGEALWWVPGKSRMVTETEAHEILDRWVATPT